MNEKNVAVKLPSNQMLFLDLCAGLELKMAELYHYFEDLFGENVQFSLLWKKTAREEENHAQQFQLGVRLKGIGMQNITTDVSQAVTFLQKVETYLEKSIASRPTQKEALILAIKLEEQLATFHMSSIVMFEDPRMKEMFEAMMDSDNGHISTLRDFLRRLETEGE